MKPYFLVALLAISSTASAIVIRTDVDDAKYRIPASAFPALADMPGEGHGVLIAPQWVVTAAHAAPSHMDMGISIGGAARRVERVFTHSGYKALPDTLIQEALASGDASKVHEFLARSDDIALVKLASPVTDVTPVALYRGNDEIGKKIELIGKGATGNGTDGQNPHSPHRTVLRHAFNIVVGADERWLWYVFDPPPSALPLEGTSGSGDSGGPVLIEDNGQKKLAGLINWVKGAQQGDVPAIRPGLYGQVDYGIRISNYIDWIESVMSAEASSRAAPGVEGR